MDFSPPDLSQSWPQMLEALSDLVLVLDPEHRVLWMNQAMADRLQTTTQAVLGTRCFEHLHGTDQAPASCPLRQVASQARARTFEAAIEPLGGTFQITIAPLLEREGKPFACIHYFHEVTEERRLARELRQERDFSRTVLEVMDALVILLDEQGRILTFNRACEQASGYTAAEVQGRLIWEVLLPPAEIERVREVFRSLRCGEAASRGENHWLTKDGRRRCISWANTMICRPLGTFVIGTGIDITEQRQMQEELRKSAHYDLLTDLPNRKLFADRLQHSIARARRARQQVAILFLDLDNFKPVNDQFGHETGDLLLKEVAKRLQASIRETDTVGRIGGDEFVVALEGLRSGQAAEPVARKIIECLQEPFRVAGHQCGIGVSIGIALYPKDGVEMTTLVKKADRAMYQAKNRGGNDFSFFGSDQEDGN